MSSFFRIAEDTYISLASVRSLKVCVDANAPSEEIANGPDMMETQSTVRTPARRKGRHQQQQDEIHLLGMRPERMGQT